LSLVLGVVGGRKAGVGVSVPPCGASEQAAYAFVFSGMGNLVDLEDWAPSILPVHQDKNGVLKVNGYASERTEDIESKDAVRLPKLEVPDHYCLAKRTASLL